MDEVWIKIEEFPNYAVSNYGRIQNVLRGTLLAPRINSYGHHRVVLYKDGVGHERMVHRVVAEAFILGFDEDVKVKHHNGDPSDNFVNNLRFAKGKRLGTLATNIRPIHIRRLRIVETGEVFKSVYDCARYLDGDPSAIYKVLRGEQHSHRGYSFEFIEEDG